MILHSSALPHAEKSHGINESQSAKGSSLEIQDWCLKMAEMAEIGQAAACRLQTPA
jgi:hypothetical protein